MAEITEIKKAAPLSITVDDGSVSVDIKNAKGEKIGVFTFRPTDIGIIDRYNKVVGEFENITAPLENVNIKNDGTVDGDDEEELAAMKEAERRLYEACDYLFGGNVSEAFFGKMHPFSPINGRFYCENALDAIGRFISSQFNKETKRIEQRVNRYTHGYKARYGKHKNGKK